MSRRSLRLATSVGGACGSNSSVVLEAKSAATKPYNRHGPKRARKAHRHTCTSSDDTHKELVKDEKLAKSCRVKAQKQEYSDAEDNEGKKYIGAHVSISGGLHLAVNRALEIGAQSFAMFLRSQRQWAAKPLLAEDALRFRDSCQEHGIQPNVILPHGIYLMNCGSPDDETLRKSREVLVDELQRCEKLGLMLYNFHPGSTCGKISVEECLDRIAESINIAHEKTKFVVTVLENMSCQGNTIGGKFEELKGVIDRVSDKSRVGICLDTCHAFAAGYDLATEKGFNTMMVDFENIIGIQYLRGVHLNDSKGELGCHFDRHENIGKGKIGRKGFQRVMKDKRFNGLPMVLETPCQSDKTYENEIRLLYSMCA